MLFRSITIVLVVTVIATAFAPLLVTLYAQRGFAPGTLGLATAFAWWCMPQILFYAVYSLIGEVLNAKGVFGPFTWAPALNNIVAIGGMLWFGAVFTGEVTAADSWSSDAVAILAGTATLGVAVQALALFAFLAAGVFPDLESAQRALCPPNRVVNPQPEAQKVYTELYAMYRALYYGLGSPDSAPVPMGTVLLSTMTL